MSPPANSHNHAQAGRAYLPPPAAPSNTDPPPSADPNIEHTAENCPVAHNLRALALLNEVIAEQRGALAAQHTELAGYHITLAQRAVVLTGETEQRLIAAYHYTAAAGESALAAKHGELAAQQREAAAQQVMLAAQSSDRVHLLRRE